MGRSRTILIVDDDPTLIETFARMLQLAGYDIVTALDAESGWREFNRVNPDAVLVDLRMTSIDGLALLQCLRADQAGQHTPVAVITGDIVLDDQVSRQLHDLNATGRVVGRVSASATAGALAGTFGTGFVLAAHFHTRIILASVGVILVVTGAILWWRLTRVRAAAGILVVGATIAAAATAAAVTGPCKVESGYFCIRVFSTPPDGQGRLLMLDDVRHSFVDLRDPRDLLFDYAKVVAAATQAAVARALRDSFPYVRVFGYQDIPGRHFLASMTPMPVRSPSQLAERLPARAAADLIEWDRSVTPAEQFAVLVPDPVDLDTLIANSPNTPALQDDRPVNEYYFFRTRKNAVVVLLLAILVAVYGILRRKDS